MIAKARANGADPGCCSGLTVLLRIGEKDVKRANESIQEFGKHLQTKSGERRRQVLEGVVRASLGGQRNGK
jgi:hypothetical protein